MQEDVDGHHLSQPLLTRIGEEVRRRRRASSMTVHQLAESAGLSRKMVTQVELGQANPSLRTVDRLAAALGVEFGTLAQSPTSGGVEVVARRDDAASSTSATGATLEFRVATSVRPSAELWEGTLPPGARLATSAGPDGSEALIYVIDGTLTLAAQSGPPLNVCATESARVPGDQPYTYSNESSSTTRFVRVFQMGAGVAQEDAKAATAPPPPQTPPNL